MDKGLCKERSDGIAIATLASIASKVIRSIAHLKNCAKQMHNKEEASE